MDLYHPQAPCELPSNQSSWEELQRRQAGRSVWVEVTARELRCLLMFGVPSILALTCPSSTVLGRLLSPLASSCHIKLHNSGSVWRTLGSVWRRDGCGLGTKCRGGVMLPGYGVLKLEVQMERAQWACICPLPLGFLQRWA